MRFAQLNFSKAALLLLDIQEDLLQASGSLACLGVQPLGNEERHTFLNNCKRLLTEARQVGMPVVYTKTVFRADLADCFLPPKWLKVFAASPSLIEGSYGVSIPSDIAPQKGDFLLDKKCLSAFQFTHLDRLLAGQGVDTCVLLGFCGVYGSIDDTARMAGLLGYEVAVAADAVYPLRSAHLKSMSNRAAVMDVEEIISLVKQIKMNKKASEDIRPALILVALNNDGNHALGSKYRYAIEAHGPGITQEARELYIQNNNRLIEAMTRKGFPVIHSQTAVRLDGADDAHAKQNWRVKGPERERKYPPGVGYMIEGTWGAEILEGVKLPENHYRVVKKGNSSFGLTHLNRLLRNLDVNFCIITGDSTTGCISDTVREGAGLGYQMIVVSDATSPASVPYHEVLATRAEVRNTEEVIELIGGLSDSRRD